MADSVKTRDVTKMSDAELAEESASNAELRTRLRLRTNEVNAELSFRDSLKAMPVETRRIVELRMSGESSSEGEAKGAQS